MTRRRQHEQRGFSLIEIMVGVVIGMIAVLVIYQVYSAAEGIKRNTTSVGDAQQNGLLSSFMMNVELANASNGVAYAMADLRACPFTPDMATSFRPIPVLITDGGTPTTPDSFVVNYSTAPRLAAAAPVDPPVPAGSPYPVQSPNGFKVDDLIVAIKGAGGADGSGACAASRVTRIDPGPGGPGPGPGPADPQGVVTISYTGASVDNATEVVNMGPRASGQRVAYDVSNNVLRSTALWDDTGAPGANAPNPIASNVVNMKLVYGIDNGAGGVDWTPATGQWSAAKVLAAPTSGNFGLGKIRAVRIGIVVRGEQWDKDAQDFNASMFDGAVAIPVSFPAAGGNYRYRIYETIIPLRNPIWNPVS